MDILEAGESAPVDGQDGAQSPSRDASQLQHLKQDQQNDATDLRALDSATEQQQQRQTSEFPMDLAVENERDNQSTNDNSRIPTTAEHEVRFCLRILYTFNQRQLYRMGGLCVSVCVHTLLSLSLCF